MLWRIPFRPKALRTERWGSSLLPYVDIVNDSQNLHIEETHIGYM